MSKNNVFQLFQLAQQTTRKLTGNFWNQVARSLAVLSKALEPDAWLISKTKKRYNNDRCLKKKLQTKFNFKGMPNVWCWNYMSDACKLRTWSWTTACCFSKLTLFFLSEAPRYHEGLAVEDQLCEESCLKRSKWNEFLGVTYGDL